MKAIVIYDSNFGNTKAIAETIAATLQCDALHVTKASREVVKNSELVIVGSPINAWQATQAIKNFLSSLGTLTGLRAAAFDTRIKIFISGNAAKKIAKTLGEKGATIISEPKVFYVKEKEGPLMEGEKENAIKWANELIQKVSPERKTFAENDFPEN